MKYKLVFLVLLVCFQTTSAQPNSLFRIDPYLQNPARDGITIMWQTVSPCYSWVEYGTDTLDLRTARTVIDGLIVSNNTENKIRIGGLCPATRYFFRICSQEVLVFEPYKKEFGPVEKSRFASFATLGDDPEDFVCIVFNDLHNKLPLFDLLWDKVKNIPYDFVLFNGDCFTDLQSGNEAVGILKHYNEKIDAANKPAYYIRGNHEVRGAFALELPRIFDRNPYFAFTYGDTRFVVLDGGEDKPDATPVYANLNDFDAFRLQETAWLREEVNSPAFKSARKRILVHHMPIYDVSERYYNPCFGLWGPILQNAPFDVAINAHTHRFTYYPRNSAGNPFPVVVGGGNNEETAKVMVLMKKDDTLNLKVIGARGESMDYPL